MDNTVIFGMYIDTTNNLSEVFYSCYFTGLLNIYFS